MRLAHITDLHVEVPARWDQLANKRIIGAANLYLMGRKNHFSGASVNALVAAVAAAAPDGVLCTGDVTALGTPEEFRTAREVLTPLLERFPTFLIPGNHDVYTGEGAGLFGAAFGPWLGEGGPREGASGTWPAVVTWGGLDLVGINVSRTSLTSQAILPIRQAEALEKLLAKGDRPAWLLVHYPLRDRRGEPYGPWTRNIANASLIERIVERHPRVKLVLHGHEHHGYRTVLPNGIPSLNPGAGGYAFLPAERRTAHFNLYTVEGGELTGVERFAFDGKAFLPEPGGAYATGR